MGDDDAVQGVIETVDSAIDYRIQLSQLVDSLHEAKNQVITSSSQARSKLRSHFDHLKLCISEALDDRLRVLGQQVSDAEQAALKPLCQCEDLLQERVNVAAGVLKEGKDLLEEEDNGPGTKENEMIKFRKKSKDLDLNSLPEVPSICETACIHIDLPRDEENVQKQLVDAIMDYGRVITRAPVQIVEIEERPAALVIKWAESPQSEEHGLDLDVFRLQYCVGTISGFGDHDEIEFVDAYEGPATGHVVRHLQPRIRYSFRVAGRTRDARLWSPWSVPQTALTTLRHHEWRPETGGYELTNDNVTARRSSGEPACILYSLLNSYVCGHSVTIRIDRAGDGSTEDGLGLSKNDFNQTNPLQKGILFINTNGVVFVDGEEKMTRLPAITEGSTVTFDTEVLSADKVRVTVEISEKIVTFDWMLDGPRGGAGEECGGGGGACAFPMSFGGVPVGEKQIELFLMARFLQSGWEFSVE